MTPQEAFEELLKIHGNAFVVASNGETTYHRCAAGMPMDKAEVANLAAWLIIVGDLSREDLAPIFEAQGVPLP